MNNFLQNSVFFGVFISIITYEIGVLIKKKLKIAIFNPLLISMALIIIFLLIFHVDYDTYESGAKYLSYFLTPATVALAVPLYEQIEPLKKNWKAILAGIFLPNAVSKHSVRLENGRDVFYFKPLNEVVVKAMCPGMIPVVALHLSFPSAV